MVQIILGSSPQIWVSIINLFNVGLTSSSEIIGYQKSQQYICIYISLWACITFSEANEGLETLH